MMAVTQILNRRGSASMWVFANPILGLGEIGLETDTLRFKWGDDVTHWVDLGYATNTVISGNNNPASNIGATGDYYLAASPLALWGPKDTTNGWSTFISLVSNTLHAGTSSPDNSLGIDGDCYINTSNLTMCGPKASGSWPAPISLIGNTILTGMNPPSTEIGFNGDCYIGQNPLCFYGPKANGIWPDAISLQRDSSNVVNVDGGGARAVYLSAQQLDGGRA